MLPTSMGIWLSHLRLAGSSNQMMFVVESLAKVCLLRSRNYERNRKMSGRMRNDRCVYCCHWLPPVNDGQSISRLGFDYCEKEL